MEIFIVIIIAVGVAYYLHNIIFSEPPCSHHWKFSETYEETLTHKKDGHVNKRVFKSYECTICKKSKREYI